MSEFSKFKVGRGYDLNPGSNGESLGWTCVYADDYSAMMARGSERRHISFPNNWKEIKETGKFFVNIYRGGGFGGPHETRRDANYLAGKTSPRIACVEVNWTEGDGL